MRGLIGAEAIRSGGGALRGNERRRTLAPAQEHDSHSPNSVAIYQIGGEQRGRRHPQGQLHRYQGLLPEDLEPVTHYMLPLSALLHSVLICSS